MNYVHSHFGRGRDIVSAKSFPAWKRGPRVRVDTMKRGDRFLSIDGVVYTYVRPDGALSGVHHVDGPNGEKTAFAGCAEGVLQ